MNYDVVIATRNRPEALKLSIPLILTQERLPKKLIIADASDNHEIVRETVIKLVAKTGCDLKILHCKPNLPHQRNKGLEYVESPVVVFPDDDSLWWPGVGEAIMQVYEQDTGGDIAGVCACPSEAKQPPPKAFLALTKSTGRMRLSDRIRNRIAGVRFRIESHISPNPLHVYGRLLWRQRRIPKWLPDLNTTPTEFMTGLCMSFRTEVLRPCGFDEDLGAYVGWAAWEDASASFRVLEGRLVVEAHDAKVYHYKFAGPRTGGFKAGFINQFNCAYLVSCYAPAGSSPRRALKRYGLYKLMQYMLAVYTSFGRQRVRGHLQALHLTKELLDISRDRLRQRYLELCEKELGSHGTT
ncbi:MAG: glycosyltransferase family 2 protein [Phycisphaerae bacterium]|jgi:glycosyltransferase involved in cell wall biosynthesis